MEHFDVIPESVETKGSIIHGLISATYQRKKQKLSM